MLMEKSLVSHSKFLSLVLRHKPEAIGIKLDNQGWIPIAELIGAAEKSGRKIDHDTLLRVVHENDKQRFAISLDGKQIRASQGHSVDIELGLSPSNPPDILYHGTVEKFIPSIKCSGLISGKRQHVHLSSNTETAGIVAKRRGIPVILIIAANKMNDAGFDFYLSANGVWLCNAVPTEYIEFP